MAFGAGLVSHFVLDAIPHYDFQGKILKQEYYNEEKGGDFGKKEFSRTGKIVIFSDLTVSLVIFLYLSLSGRIWPNFPDLISFAFFLFDNLHLAAGVLGGVLPDLANLVCIKTGFCQPKWFFKFHKKIQIVKIGIVPGLIFQIALAIFSLYYFMR